MHLFIDTNILLNLYTYPDDDDGVVDALIANIGPDQIVLHLPKQVENEFERNRESKLHGAVFEFKKVVSLRACPITCGALRPQTITRLRSNSRSRRERN
ncbi:PIN-like domain-containing protein [Pseudomonas congelans]|uniref:PIN-like domain-containing protein n=1 Tax=Pseudomonas congelans TaxID=200452 RepID=UPI001BDCE4A3|nr:DUF4935 domain-containing protein [Pseudomonas congelans]